MEWSPRRGFLLDDTHVKIRGFCNHNNFAGVGMAVPDHVNLARVQTLRGLGGNAWRMSHNPPDPALLDMMDRLGVLVLDENRWFNPSPDEQVYLDGFTEMAKRDRHHASVIAW